MPDSCSPRAPKILLPAFPAGSAAVPKLLNTCPTVAGRSHPRGRVFAVHPATPLLRRAEWAVVWWAGAAWAGCSRRCLGPQAVARAELAFVVWASVAAPDLVEVVMDCLTVARGAAAMDVGHGAPLLQGPMGVFLPK